MRNVLLVGLFILSATIAFFLVPDPQRRTAQELLPLPVVEPPRVVEHNMPPADGWYDNRDGNHSGFDLSPHPRFRRVEYSPEDVKAKRHFGLSSRVLPFVVFGNSSTAAPVVEGGSNTRTAYTEPGGLELLARQYLGNNLYVYPEHLDHDPGHNGSGGGYGDLMPTNTPYLITSQGSSYTDQPFLKAIALTLEAFRPEVKRQLIETGLLMPTVQMLLRSTMRNLSSFEEYFTGKAHPSVFEGTMVDPVKMANAAQALTASDLPPLVKLEVMEEDTAVNGRDYFEPTGVTEKLGDTDSVIARVWRSGARSRRLLVSAAKSIHPNKKPLIFSWVLLRGDEKRVKIKVVGQEGALAEIVVEYQERRPIAPGSPLASNRVDIGVFARHGGLASAPAFITLFTLDSEARKYDEAGRLVEIAHNRNYVDPRLSPPKAYRDVYLYQGDRLTGWKRYPHGNPEAASEFTADGLLIVGKDVQGRATKVRRVEYFQAPGKPEEINTNPLQQRLVGEVIPRNP